MISGSMVALVTPMKPNGELDWDALDKLVDWHVDNGTDAIVSVGTTGESATLSMNEHSEVIARVVSRVEKRIPVIAGTGANNTDEAIELTLGAKRSGADACLLVTPYYNKPTQEGMYQHFKKIAETVQIPQILYNVPGRTACDMSAETTLRLAELPNIVGIKDATGDMERARELIEQAPEGFAIYSGDDGTAAALMLLGGQGNISVTANVAPKQMSELCRMCIEGNAEQARNTNEELAELHKILFIESSPIPVKWALYEMGRIDSGIRLPLVPLSESCREPLKQALQRAGIL